jgi:hypothetical protein
MKQNLIYKASLIFLAFVTTSLTVQAAELVNSGTFTQGLANWQKVEFTSGCKVTAETAGGNTYIKLHHDAKSDWCSIYQEIASKLVKNKIYRFSYRYKTSVASQQIGVHFADQSSVMHSSAISEAYGWSHTLIADNKWHTDSFIFLASDTLPKSDEPMLTIHMDYNTVGDIYIDNVSIQDATNKSFEATTYDRATKVFNAPNVIEN